MKISLVEDRIGHKRSKGEKAHQLPFHEKRDDPAGLQRVEIACERIRFLPGQSLKERPAHQHMGSGLMDELQKRCIDRKTDPFGSRDRPAESGADFEVILERIRNKKCHTLQMQHFPEGIHNKVRDLLEVQIHGQIAREVHQSHLGECFLMEKIFLEEFF